MQAGKDWICKIRGEPIGELAAFLACREARIEMLRPYTKFACVQSRTPMTEGRIRDQYLFEQHYRTYKHEYLTHDSVTYVDLRRDMIFLGSGYFPATFDIITSFLGKHLGEVRSLAISFEYCQYKEVYSRLRNLGRLEELIFVASPERRRTWPGGMTRISLQNIELTSRPLCDIDFLLNDISTGYYDPDTKLNYPRVSLADYKKIPCDITREWEIVRQEWVQLPCDRNIFQSLERCCDFQVRECNIRIKEYLWLKT